MFRFARLARGGTCSLQCCGQGSWLTNFHPRTYSSDVRCLTSRNGVSLSHPCVSGTSVPKVKVPPPMRNLVHCRRAIDLRHANNGVNRFPSPCTNRQTHREAPPTSSTLLSELACVAISSYTLPSAMQIMSRSPYEGYPRLIVRNTGQMLLRITSRVYRPMAPLYIQIVFVPSDCGLILGNGRHSASRYGCQIR